MRKVHARRYMIPAAVLAVFGLVFWVGCSQDLMEPDIDPPSGSAITNPVDGSSLNRETINVRGRAEVGATIEGTAVSSPAVPNDGLGGRFTVDDVSLGDEGMKDLRARITDLYGNVATADETPRITIILDQTPPPISLTPPVEGAEWVDTLGFWGDGFWKTGLPTVIVSGSTDTSASGARLRFGINEHVANEFVPGPGITLDFTIDVTTPPLSGGHADTLMSYFLEAFDAAGNVGAEPLFIHWEVEGKEEELSHDDGTYTSWEHTITLRPGHKIAVRFQAPTWANYVTKFIFYSANDQVDNPIHPDDPSTMPFEAWIWRVTVPDSLPGPAGNDGYLPFTEPYMYPEDEWVTITFPNAIDINDNTHYPDKKFFVGLEWQYRHSPHIYEDDTEPLAFKSFFWNWSEWELRDERDTMIRAVVSDVPTLDGGGREAVLLPTRVPR